MNNLEKASALACCALLCVIPTAYSAIVAYEGFDTTNANGSDVSAVGATGQGFLDPVHEVDTDYRLDIENGLSYTDSFGNSLQVTGKSAGMEAAVSGTQNLQLKLASPIQNSGTYYMSYLLNVTAVFEWGMISGLSNGQATDSGDPTSLMTAGIRSNSGGTFGIYVASPLVDNRSGPAAAPGLFLFVTELNMDAETITTWVNPTNLTDVTNTASHTITGSLTSTWPQMDNFVFSLGTEEAGTIDEIRIGTTLADVTPVPEPKRVALFSSLIVWALFIARRRSF